MSNEIELTIRGNAGGKPALYEGANGGVAVRFTVAVSARRRMEDGQYVNTEPQWFPVKAFGFLGRNVAQCVDRGTPVLVRGELVTEHWKNAEGQDRTSQVVRADSVGIELHNGIAHYIKVVRDSPLANSTDFRPAEPPDVSGMTEVGSGLSGVNTGSALEDPAEEQETDGAPF